MISNSLENGCAPPESVDKGATVFCGANPKDTVTTSADLVHESEISRLTWAVLDGKATPSERLRLAELVSEQHAKRA